MDNKLKNDAKIFSISLLATGKIRDCLFLNQTGENDGFFLLVENALLEINIQVNFFL